MLIRKVPFLWLSLEAREGVKAVGLFFMVITFIGTFYYFLSCYLPLLCKNNGQNASLSARKLPV